jgi:hypothetical protein
MLQKRLLENGKKDYLEATKLAITHRQAMSKA